METLGNLGAEYPKAQKRLTFELIVGFYEPQKVEGYLLSAPQLRCWGLGFMGFRV